LIKRHSFVAEAKARDNESITDVAVELSRLKEERSSLGAAPLSAKAINSLRYQHLTRFPKKPRKSPSTSKDRFFDELTRKGDKRFKLLFLEKQRQEKEMQGCTFKPEVHPLPEPVPDMVTSGSFLI
jgi:hypothetical protein